MKCSGKTLGLDAPNIDTQQDISTWECYPEWLNILGKTRVGDTGKLYVVVSPTPYVTIQSYTYVYIYIYIFTLHLFISQYWMLNGLLVNSEILWFCLGNNFTPPWVVRMNSIIHYCHQHVTCKIMPSTISKHVWPFASSLLTLYTPLEAESDWKSRQNFPTF